MIVTFDFDDTLLMTRFDEDLGFIEIGPNQNTLGVLRDLARQGHEIHIVTSRIEALESRGNRMSVTDFVGLFKLPVKGIHFTNGDLKVETLVKLGSELHFDDDADEIKTAEAVGIRCIRI